MSRTKLRIDQRENFNMALKTQQTVTITGTSEIDGQQVAYFYATVPTNGGNLKISRNVTSQTLYDDNRHQVRSDEAEFQAKVYEIEDGIYNGVHE